MPDVVLSEREQAALQALLGVDQIPGHRLPRVSTLEAIRKLIPCDEVSSCLADATGCLVDLVALPHLTLDDVDRQVCDGPLRVGIVHQRVDPVHQELGARLGLSARLVIGFSTGRNHVVQLRFVRKRRGFSARDVAVLRMITPTLERLLRSSATTQLPVSLTVQERRVLRCCAEGMSNPDIAVRMYISPSTVRKHLEHAFRKLGVTNRLAAVVAFEAALRPEPASRRYA
ncbi:MAG TPA: LuxR C-terminal-related transcriptional regulator [Intrasporangium sp.]|uniref:helix-turn-helix transcriptional regulator n=1 Tax=Intrasporangium sp. TaxID=1925024 RepID=UPI002B4621D6|nr:LuxR C-terminal-related transcriptional regulator [Intrasporangium sp.]HKX68427.1 LuxR C-terminal-related transcriptional regulator [Intrasporangium sp.]